MTDYFKVKNWENFQHYKDRNPPWIKLHNQLLDNYEFELLGDASKGHLLCIWMLASRTQNKMPYDPKWIGKKIGASSKVDLQTLENSGFIECLHDASKVLHKENNSDSVSVPLEEKSRVETDKSITTSDLDYSNLQMTDDHILELKRIRKSNKGGKVSQRVINGLAKEFNLARQSGLTNDQILTEWELRGWKSFKAEWVKSNFNKQNEPNFDDTSTDWALNLSKDEF